MRVISGTYKGRILQTKKGVSTRPTLDRCKETLVNIMRQQLDGANCLELFCGSGQVGIEFLSNGAKSCIFVDNDRAATDITKSNLQLLNLQQKVVCSDYRSALTSISPQSIDIVFADPPFAQNIYEQILSSIDKSQILCPNAVVICESNFQLCDCVENLTKIRKKKIGSVYFSFYKQSEV